MTARGAKSGAKPGAKSAKPRVCGGIFTADTTLPADQAGRQVCRCGLLGEPGDAHHTLPDAGPEQAEHLRRYEHEDGGER